MSTRTSSTGSLRAEQTVGSTTDSCGHPAHGPSDHRHGFRRACYTPVHDSTISPGGAGVYGPNGSADKHRGGESGHVHRICNGCHRNRLCHCDVVIALDSLGRVPVWPAYPAAPILAPDLGRRAFL